MRHLYAKLGVHTRADAVDRARALGLLAPLRHVRIDRRKCGGGSARVGSDKALNHIEM